MGKFDGILICTDLDGTLYKNDKTISRENKNAIEYFKSEGGYFTFITGRLPYYSLSAYNDAKPNAPYGCANGGGVYDGKAEKYIWTYEMPRNALELVKHIDNSFSDVGIQVCLFDKTYFVRDNDTTEKFRKTTGLPHLVCNREDICEPIAKLIFSSGCESTLFDIERSLKSHSLSSEFDFVRSSRTLFEVLPKGATKGLSLSKLVEYLKTDSKKTVAIGDYNNDISMFKSANLGIAVSNACPDALKEADYVTVSNEEHAIAKVIYDLESGALSFK